jgi:tRNA pseudouridine55 synthase
MYSAKKIAGKKLYELARQGVEVERNPVKVMIYELETIEPQVTQRKTEQETKDQKPNTADHALRVTCSAGTYIRTLAEDIGRKLGTGAHLAELRRTRAGIFELSKAVSLEKLEAIVAAENLDDYLVPMNEAVSHLRQVILSEKEIEDTRNGKRLRYGTGELAENETVRMIDAAANLIAIGLHLKQEKFIQPKLVLL